MKTAVLPGTFNPPTLGHLDIIQRASKLCDRLLVAIINNPNKQTGPFTFDEKTALLSKACTPFRNVEIVGYLGLLVEFAKSSNADFIIRGLRTTADFEYEKQMAVANSIMSGVETIFLITSPEYAHISSSLTREIASLGHRLHDFVPAEIEQDIFEKLSLPTRS